jgi:hypothetical protein
MKSKDRIYKETSTEIVDLKNASGEATGTKVVMEIPFEEV